MTEIVLTPGYSISGNTICCDTGSGEGPKAATSVRLVLWSVILFAALLCAEFKCFELLIGRGDA